MRNLFGTEKAAGLLRLGIGHGLRCQLGPDALPIVGEHLAARHQAARGRLDRRTVNDWDRPSSVGPAAYIWGMRADGFR